MNDQFWLTDGHVGRLRPPFPKARGKPRVDDRRVLSGIIDQSRNSLCWGDAPPVYGPHKTYVTRGAATRCIRCADLFPSATCLASHCPLLPVMASPGPSCSVPRIERGPYLLDP